MDKILASLSEAGVISKDELEQNFSAQIHAPKPTTPINQNENNNQNTTSIQQLPAVTVQLNPFQNLNLHSFWPNPNPQAWKSLTQKKKIILLGPAQYTLAIPRGELVERFDFVSRCNHSIPVFPQHHKAIGTSTHLYYNNLFVQGKKNQLTPDLLQRCHVKMVIGSYPYIRNYRKDIMRYYTKREGGDLPFRTMPVDLYNEVERAVKTRPNTGILALMDLLCSGADMVFLSGFTFFTTPTTYSKQTGIDQSLHNQAPQKDYVKYLSVVSTKLILDAHLRSLLWGAETKWMMQQWLLIQKMPISDSIQERWNTNPNLRDCSYIQECYWEWDATEMKATLRHLTEEAPVLELAMEEFDVLTKRIFSKELPMAPQWVEFWWVLQMNWICSVVIPICQKHTDTLLTVPWVWVENKQQKTMPAEYFQTLLMSSNRFPFFQVLKAIQYAAWYSHQKEVEQLISWKKFFG
jgi:hypothetical protein